MEKWNCHIQIYQIPISRIKFWPEAGSPSQCAHSQPFAGGFVPWTGKWKQVRCTVSVSPSENRIPVDSIFFISQRILEQSWSGSPTPPNALTLPFFAVSGCQDGYPSMTGKSHECQNRLHHQRWTLLWFHGLERQRIHVTTTSSLFLAGFFLSLVGTCPTFWCFEPLLQSPKEEKKAHVSCLASFHAIPFLTIQPSKHVLSLLVQLSRQTSTHNHLLLSTFLQSQSHLSLFLRIWQLRLFQPCSHLDIWFWKTANHSAQEPENFPVHHLLAHVHFLERACSWQMKYIFLQLVSIAVWKCVVQLRCIKIM